MCLSNYVCTDVRVQLCVVQGAHGGPLTGCAVFPPRVCVPVPSVLSPALLWEVTLSGISHHTHRLTCTSACVVQHMRCTLTTHNRVHVTDRVSSASARSVYMYMYVCSVCMYVHVYVCIYVCVWGGGGGGVLW